MSQSNPKLSALLTDSNPRINSILTQFFTQNSLNGDIDEQMAIDLLELHGELADFVDFSPQISSNGTTDFFNNHKTAVIDAASSESYNYNGGDLPQFLVDDLGADDELIGDISDVVNHCDDIDADNFDAIAELLVQAAASRLANLIQADL